MKKGTIKNLLVTTISLCAIGALTLLPSTASAQSRAACETQTIPIGDIKIAACNVGATEAGTGEDSYGYHFQR